MNGHAMPTKTPAHSNPLPPKPSNSVQLSVSPEPSGSDSGGRGRRPARDRTRLSSIKPLGAEAAERVVALMLGEPPGERHTGLEPLMAKAAGSA